MERNIDLDSDKARRLADAMMRRRVELGIRSARMLGEQSGLDYRTITGLEACRRHNVTRNTLAILEMHLQWPAGYLNALLDSTEPSGSARTVVMDVPSYATVDSVERAKKVAQAAFDAALRQME